MMKPSTIHRRIMVAECEHKALLALRGTKTRKQINRMDTVRKKLHKLRAKLNMVS
jgi:hypothetical protein